MNSEFGLGASHGNSGGFKHTKGIVMKGKKRGKEYKAMRPQEIFFVFTIFCFCFSSFSMTQMLDRQERTMDVRIRPPVQGTNINGK